MVFQVQCLVLEVIEGVWEVILHSQRLVVRLALDRGRRRCRYCCRWNLLRVVRQLRDRRRLCLVKGPSVSPQMFLVILRNVMVIMVIVMVDQMVEEHCPLHRVPMVGGDVVV